MSEQALVSFVEGGLDRIEEDDGYCHHRNIELLEGSGARRAYLGLGATQVSLAVRVRCQDCGTTHPGAYLAMILRKGPP